MKAVVKENREVARGTRFVVFDLLGADVDYRPGQYFWVELPDRGDNDEKGLRRHISIATSPTEHGVLGLATRIRDTAFKRTLTQLAPGDEVIVEEPKGDFSLPEDTDPRWVFVAGGIGITVFRSMLKYIADTGAPYGVTLVYSNRDRAGTAFLDELEHIGSQIPDFRMILTMTDDEGWDGETRRIGAGMLAEHLGDLRAHSFIVAGPPEMAQTVADDLLQHGVPEEQVLFQRFSGY